MSKIGFISLGCPKNLVDSEVMLGLLQKAGHTVTTDKSEADVIIVNTCSFIESSKRESIETILEMAELKKSGRCKRLVVTGCLAERYPREIRSELVEVDAILGTNQIEEITRAAEGGIVLPPASFGRSDADLYLYDHTTPRARATPRYSAYMKIAEGCDHTCAFCIIPKIRGSFRSRGVPSLCRAICASTFGKNSIGNRKGKPARPVFVKTEFFPATERARIFSSCSRETNGMSQARNRTASARVVFRAV